MNEYGLSNTLAPIPDKKLSCIIDKMQASKHTRDRAAFQTKQEMRSASKIDDAMKQSKNRYPTPLIGDRSPVVKTTATKLRPQDQFNMTMESFSMNRRAGSQMTGKSAMNSIDNNSKLAQ